MSEDIAEPGNLSPVRLRVPFPEILRQALDRLADYLKIPDDCIAAPPVVGKFLKRDPARIFLNIFYRFENVIEQLERGS